MSNRAPDRQRLLLKAVLGLGVTTVLVLILFHFIDLHQLSALLATTNWKLVLLGLGLWLVIYLARAWRFVVLAPRTPYLTMLCIVSVQNLLLRILPMRTGDLSYAFLVRRAGTAGLGESLLGLLLLRTIDATVVVVLFTVALLLDQGLYLSDRRLGVTAATIAAVIGMIAVLTMGRLLRIAARVMRRLLRLLGLAERPRLADLLARTERAITSFSSIGIGAILQIGLASLVAWLLIFACYFAIMRGFSMPVSIAQTVLGSTAAVVTGFLPIGGIGSFGTLEAGWALGFALVGLSRQQAVATGFGVSLATFAYGAILGLVGWAGLSLTSRREVA